MPKLKPRSAELWNWMLWQMLSWQQRTRSISRFKTLLRAAILEAQASAWLVRANAYTQSAMAELIRVRSIDLANSGAQLKFGSTDVNTLRNNTSQALQRGS